MCADRIPIFHIEGEDLTFRVLLAILQRVFSIYYFFISYTTLSYPIHS